MTYKWIYKTPPQFDDILMNSDGKFLTGLWFDESKDAAKHKIECEEKYLDIFGETCLWLDIYFGGKQLDFIPAYRLENFTEFRGEVADIMKEIPFGATLTYNDIAKRIAESRGIERMSAQAVGGAVGSNTICIIIPCHRVVGTNGSLTGYGGGIKNKEALLIHERVDMSKFFIPKKGTAL